MKWLARLVMLTAPLVGCSGNTAPPPQPVVTPAPAKGVEVHAPGVDVNVGHGGVDVKAPGTDVQVDRNK
jgi:hypothetical protein